MNEAQRQINFKIETMDQYGNKKNPQEFDILNLIQEVKKHPILYAKDIKASKESREEAWHTISSELDTPLQIVKTKWRSLRDSLSRLKRDRSRRGKKTWYMLKHLTFLPSVTELLDNPQDIKNENYYDDVIECHDLSHDDAIRYIDGVEEFAQENTEMVDLKYVKINGETSDEEIDNENEMPAPPPIKKIKLLKPLTQSQKTTPMYKAIVPKPAETTYIKFSHFSGDEGNEEYTPLTVDQNCIQIVSPISPEIIEQNANRTESVKTGEEAQQRLTEHLSNICSHFSTEEFGYSVHIANQLRNLPRLEREILRNKIDNLIYETHMSVITSQSN
ncbi:uncharacterized protein LOC119085105 [Bradysia coprophila]|uniref:uncharacterized protein LOC119085105 n=1 Tax=Bradysia coprophila TaxID=38358 RepID=UPI00187D8D07|nr:uncharacterized protein LOC119085105 [Bradysia coprophila]